MKKSSENVKIFQWNSRSISTNILAFENHISQSNYCILGLQSLNVEKRKHPRMKNYYYPPLCNSNKNTKKVQTAIYIRSDLVYTIPISSPVTNTLEEIYATTAMVKINEQTTLNVISVYFPNGPKGDNTDWLKDIALSKQKLCDCGRFQRTCTFWGKRMYISDL